MINLYDNPPTVKIFGTLQVEFGSEKFGTAAKG